MRRYLLIGATISLLAVPAAFGRATTTVEVSDNFFSPQNVTRTVGAPGAVHWEWDGGGSHNVRQDVKLFYSGPATAAPHSFDIRPSAGSFHYYCEVHGALGMEGTIKVRPRIFNKTDHSFIVMWARPAEQTGDTFDARYRVDGGPWKPWVTDQTTDTGWFGDNDRPVHVGPGHTYDIQARSKNFAHPSKVSGWSPTARTTY
jgi:plastocyanin